MPEMTYTQLLVIAGLPAAAALILAKTDQQIVHMLEGALHKKGQDTSAAKVAYQTRKLPYSSVALVSGFTLAVIAASFIDQSRGFWIALSLGISLMGIGSYQRVAAFRAASKDLGLG